MKTGFFGYISSLASLLFFVFGNLVGWYSPDSTTLELTIFGTGLAVGVLATARSRHQRLGLWLLLLNCGGLVFAALEMPLPWIYRVTHH